jgi:hypothetical protein
MPTKTLYISGATGVMMICDYGTSLNALASPLSYLPSLNFHSGLAYLNIKSIIEVGTVTLPAAAPYSYTYTQSSGKGGC